MSEDPNLQSMYKVDAEQAMQVKIYNKSGKILDHVFIGNGTDTSFDYGRRNGDKRIYQFKNNLTNLVKPDIYLWRSTNITNLKRSQIDFIDVTYTKNAYKLTVLGDSIRYTDTTESFMIPFYNRAQHKVINALENLMTWQFLDKGTEQWADEFQESRMHHCRASQRQENQDLYPHPQNRKTCPIPSPILRKVMSLF